MEFDPWIVVALVVAIGWYLSHQAGRIDRLHQRIEQLHSTLDANLALRAATACELAAFLDPASEAILLAVAHEALTAHGNDAALSDIARCESELTSTIVEVCSDAATVEALLRSATAAQLLQDLQEVGRKVSMSRRFHADLVQACRRIRAQRLVRVFYLAGRAAMPSPMDFADDISGIGIPRPRG